MLMLLCMSDAAGRWFRLELKGCLFVTTCQVFLVFFLTYGQASSSHLFTPSENFLSKGPSPTNKLGNLSLGIPWNISALTGALAWTDSTVGHRKRRPDLNEKSLTVPLSCAAATTFNSGATSHPTWI